jgi:Outer membrane protein beta-barrel domain
MRNREVRSCLVALMLSCLASAAAWAQPSRGSVVGFGGLTINGATSQPSFGGAVGVDLMPNIQVVGEVGRISNVLPSTLNQLIALTPVDLKVSAFYGEGGVRLLTGAHAPVRGYVETTAGFARLSTRFSGIDGVDSYVNTGLAFFDRTSPMLGVGGGVVMQFGSVLLDVGYRYKRIMGNGTLDRVLTGGDNINVNQLRLGVGFRF